MQMDIVLLGYTSRWVHIKALFLGDIPKLNRLLLE